MGLKLYLNAIIKKCLVYIANKLKFSTLKYILNYKISNPFFKINHKERAVYWKLNYVIFILLKLWKRIMTWKTVYYTVLKHLSTVHYMYYNPLLYTSLISLITSINNYLHKYMYRLDVWKCPQIIWITKTVQNLELF